MSDDIKPLLVSELIERQGWSDDTLWRFAEDFIVDKGLWDEYAAWLHQKAREENGEDDVPPPPQVEAPPDPYDTCASCDVWHYCHESSPLACDKFTPRER